MTNVSKKSSPKLGEILLEHHLITPQQLKQALQAQKTAKQRLGAILIHNGWVSEEDINFILSQQLDVPYVHLTVDMIDIELVKSIPQPILDRYIALPLIRLQNQLTVVMADPTDHEALAELATVSHCVITPALGQSSTICKLLEYVFGTARTKLSTPATLDSEPSYTGSLDFVKTCLMDAISHHATEIHFEPTEKEYRIRYRMDDKLVVTGSLIKSQFPSFVTRIKILFQFDLNKQKIPFSGNIPFDLNNQTIQLQAVILPTARGPSITLRIRQPLRSPISLLELAGKDIRKKMSPILKKTNGIILISSPSDNLRATLGYALLNEYKGDDRKIITIEKFLTYTNEDYIQLSIEDTPDLTKDKAFTRALNQGGDIILVDLDENHNFPEKVFESCTRDKLILGAVPYRNSMEVLSWLQSDHVKPFLISSYLHGIIAANQFHRLCPSCKTSYSRNDMDSSGKKNKTKKKIGYRSPGCKKCNQRGFIGFVNIFEVFILSPTIKKLFASKIDWDVILEAVEKTVTDSIRKQALDKAEKGLIDFDEIFHKLGDFES